MIPYHLRIQNLTKVLVNMKQKLYITIVLIDVNHYLVLLSTLRVRLLLTKHLPHLLSERLIKYPVYKGISQMVDHIHSSQR